MSLQFYDVACSQRIASSQKFQVAQFSLHFMKTEGSLPRPQEPSALTAHSQKYDVHIVFLCFRAIIVRVLKVVAQSDCC